MNAPLPKKANMRSHYSDPPTAEPIARHTLAVVVDNEPGVLARIAGMFSGRGYNIESLTVTETEHEAHLAHHHRHRRHQRSHRADQEPARAARPGASGRRPHRPGRGVERELPREGGRQGRCPGRGDAPAAAFGARTLDATLTSFVFELTGTTEEVERFISLMTVVGLVEVSAPASRPWARGGSALNESRKSANHDQALSRPRSMLLRGPYGAGGIRPRV